MIDDPALSLEEKIKALDIWEQDARQMLTVSGEGMPGSEEGKDPNDRPLLAQVQRAKDKLQRQLTPKTKLTSPSAQLATHIRLFVREVFDRELKDRLS